MSHVKKLMILVSAFWILGFSGTISAGLMPPETLDIDFRSADWAGADGQKHYTFHGVRVEAFPDRDYFLGIIPIPEAKLTQDDTDGLGNKHSFGGEPDELDNRQVGEYIVIDFEEPWKLNAIWLSNLFPDEIFVCRKSFLILCLEKEYLDEIGGYSIDEDDPVLFDAAYDSGFLRIGLEEDVIPQKIAFFVPRDEDASDKSDFSIVGFEAMKGGGAAVPVPATLALFGLGLVLLASRSARK